MAIIGDEDLTYLKERFGNELKSQVQLDFFTRGVYFAPEAVVSGVEANQEDDPTGEIFAGEANRVTALILEELAAIAPASLKVVRHDLDLPESRPVAEEAGLDPQRLPAIVFKSENLKGQFRYTGLPSGYEFGSLVENILDLSGNQRVLKQVTLDKLAPVQVPVELLVFVTPTWGYCPAAVRLANQFAMANENIKAEVVEANEFMELANTNEVYGVPKIVIKSSRGSAEFEGAQPESVFVQNILKVI